MNFGFDNVIQTIGASFKMNKVLVAVVHLAIAIGAIAVAVILGMMLPMVVFYIIAVLATIVMYFAISRGSYILTYMAYKSDKDGNADYKEAEESFNANLVKILLIGIVFALIVVAVVLVEAGLIYLLMLVPFVGQIVGSILFLPLFALNLALLVIIAFGSGFMFPIMVDKDTSVGGTVKSILNLVKKKFQSILIYNIITGLIVGSLLLILVALVVFAIIPAGAAIMETIVALPMSFAMLMYGQIAAIEYIISGIIAVISFSAVIAALLGVFMNIGVHTNVAIYKAVSDGVNLDEDINIKDVKMPGAAE